jgi:hypothetical protein
LGTALTAFLANVGTYLFPTREAVLVSCLLDLALLVFVTGITLSHVVEEGKVDAGRIFGAVCGYLLIGLTWALIRRPVSGPARLVRPRGRPERRRTPQRQIQRLTSPTWTPFSTTAW